MSYRSPFAATGLRPLLKKIPLGAEFLTPLPAKSVRKAIYLVSKSTDRRFSYRTEKNETGTHIRIERVE